MSSNKVVKKEKLRAFKSIWDFFAGNNKSPKTIEVLMDLAKLEINLKKLRRLEKDQEEFEKETIILERAKCKFYNSPSSSLEHYLAKRDIEKILKIRL